MRGFFEEVSFTFLGRIFKETSHIFATRVTVVYIIYCRSSPSSSSSSSSR
jgi:hypothetical protein